MSTKEIAKTIQQQIFAIGFPIVMSWGPSDYKSVSEKVLKDFKVEGMGALKFQVSGMKFKGIVLVVLNFMDTYDIYFGKVEKNEFKIEKTFENIYCDQLGTIIDEYVEKQDNYRF